MAIAGKSWLFGLRCEKPGQLPASLCQRLRRAFLLDHAFSANGNGVGMAATAAAVADGKQRQ